MIEWLKGLSKEYPDFWKNYLKNFKQKSNRFVVLAIESSGLNPKEDVILSIACIGIENNAIQVKDTFEVSIAQYKFLHSNKLTTTFFNDASQTKMVEDQAIENFINYIENSTLVGHRIGFDIEILNEALSKLNCGRLKNDALDIEVMYKRLHDISDRNFTLDELATLLKIPKTDRISTSDDAYSMALLFLKLKQRLKL